MYCTFINFIQDNINKYDFNNAIEEIPNELNINIENKGHPDEFICK